MAKYQNSFGNLSATVVFIGKIIEKPLILTAKNVLLFFGMIKITWLFCLLYYVRSRRNQERYFTLQVQSSFLLQKELYLYLCTIQHYSYMRFLFVFLYLNLLEIQQCLYLCFQISFSNEFQTYQLFSPQKYVVHISVSILNDIANN